MYVIFLIKKMSISIEYWINAVAGEGLAFYSSRDTLVVF